MRANYASKQYFIADGWEGLKYVRAEFVKLSTIYIAVGDTFEPLAWLVGFFNFHPLKNGKC